MKDNPNNRQMISSHLKDFQHHTYEEAALKKEIVDNLGIMVSPPGLLSYDLYLDKFDSNVLQRLRIAFMNSKTLIGKGGAEFALNADFKKPIDAQSETLTFQFLIDSLESSLRQLKPIEFYDREWDRLQFPDSVREYNARNLAMTHRDEVHLLTKNIEYLKKQRAKNLQQFHH